MRKPFRAITVLTLILAGCAGKHSTTPPAAASGSTGGVMMAVTEANSGVAPNPPNPTNAPPVDAVAAIPVAFNLFLYQLEVPFGNVSGNEVFWKHVNEDSVDVATHDLLLKNGVRCGHADVSEWPYFKNVLDQTTTRYEKSVVSGEFGKDTELECSDPLDEELLFVFDEHGSPAGRSYLHCQNFLLMSFEPAPRKERTARIRICPMVRSLRRRYEYTMLNEQEEVTFRKAEKLYDLRLCADVAPGQFLVIAPSTDAINGPTSVGRNFLIRGGEADRYERVLILVSQPVSLEKVAPTANKPTPEADQAPAAQ